MTAAVTGAVVVVRLAFVPAHLHTGLDELRDLLVGSEPLRRKVNLLREADGTDTLGVHEVLEIALQVAGSDAASNIVGGILGGAVESAIALWLIARAGRSTGAASEERPVRGRGARHPARLLEGAGVRYVHGDDGPAGIDVRLTDRPEVNRAILAAGALLLAALAPADPDQTPETPQTDQTPQTDETDETGPTGAVS